MIFKIKSFNNIKEKIVMYKWQEKLEEKIKTYLDGYTACHDFFHMNRVKNWALKIAQEIDCDKEILVAAALLHDVGYKDHEDDDDNHHLYSMEIAKVWLSEVGFPKNKIHDVLESIRLHDNMGLVEKVDTNHTETKIIQDADRIDSMGAIGLVRITYYYGERGLPIYSDKPVIEDPKKLWLDHSLLDQFQRDSLKMYERLNYPISIKLTEKRHRFMINFYEEFKKELQSEDL